MNGAHTLLDTLVASGIEVCFANPGTSEMHLVTAIGKSDRVRPVLCLFEGVVSGAADGYARMSGKPAITLLHLAPGYANGMANLHNAQKAHSSIVNIVGDHAVWHHQYDAPLTSDVPGHARLQSQWVRVSASAEDLALAGAEAVQAARGGAGRIATLIVPANHAWEAATASADVLTPEPLATVGEDAIAAVAAALANGRRTALVLGAGALRERALIAAGRLHQASGATLLCETFPARLERGAGRVPLARIPYFAEQAIEFLRDFEQMILVGCKPPAAFFAYPGVASLLAPEQCAMLTLAGIDDDIPAALEAVAERLGAGDDYPVQVRVQPERPDGDLSPAAIGDVISAHLPEDAIVTDEGITCGLELFLRTQGAPRHDWLAITGGSIGFGLPVSFGAAIACPGRKVVAFQADGSAMYTVQALWSMARENTDVTVVLLNNSSYAILNVELARLKAGEPTPKTLSMLDLANPVIDWCDIARGMGVTASRVDSVAAFAETFAAAMRERGPRLIEVMVQQDLGAALRR
ncbi:MAG: acetolactate synthase large subunit [Gammaproteobacteria bacterium]|nr:acetolactate synthase large subunit [Gammaproteobacteria bacterium]MCP5201571.1 acetolactate synthase large subunit [Gammaproteobacteria bacterium]